MPATALTADLSHFLELARRGRHGYASRGEAAAWRLAHAVMDYAPGLDASARAGLAEFLEIAAAYPNSVRDLLEG